MNNLILRTIEIDYLYGHRHAASSLSALPIIAGIYSRMNLRQDVFILSKGHACAALYAVLEAHGYNPDVTKVHPERDPLNGITITSGSLGHGLPIAVGMASAKKFAGEPGTVYVLMGDGECMEGTTWESLHLAARLKLDNLSVHVDWNDYQSSDPLLVNPFIAMSSIFNVTFHKTKKGQGVKMFEDKPYETTHKITPAEFDQIKAEVATAKQPQYVARGTIEDIMEGKVEVEAQNAD